MSQYDDAISPTDHDQRILETAEALAKALDKDDFETAKSLMGPGVVYQIGDDRLVGPEAVVDSYRRASGMAHALFDTVDYDHVIQGVIEQNTVRIRYSDLLGVGEDQHSHIAVQDITIDPTLGIVEIVDRPVPGEREKLDGFLASHQMVRPDSV